MDDQLYLPPVSEMEKGGLFGEKLWQMKALRTQALELLKLAPSFADVAQKTMAAGTYTIQVSAKHKHLVKEGLDGITKTTLRGANGRFVENVGLVRAPRNIAGGLSSVALQMSLAQITAKLDAIQEEVGNVHDLLRNTNTGSLEGAMDGLRLALENEDPARREAQANTAIPLLRKEIGMLIGQFKSSVALMPEAKTGFFDGWTGSGLAKSLEAGKKVQGDLKVILEASRLLLTAQLQVGETKVALENLKGLQKALHDAGWEDAKRKARLIPFNEGGKEIEGAMAGFEEGIPALQERIQRLAADGGQDLFLTLSTEDVQDYLPAPTEETVLASSSEQLESPEADIGGIKS